MSVTAIHSQSGASMRRPLVLLVGLGGVVLSLLVYAAMTFHQRQLVEAQFKFDAEQRLHAVENALTGRLTVARTLVAFYAGSQRVERHEFQTFCRPLLTEYPCTRLLGWAPRIANSERIAHEQAVRAEGQDDYRIVERNTQQQLVAAAQRKEYLPACFLQRQSKADDADEKMSPTDGISLGMDLAASPRYAAVFRQASETKRPVAAAVEYSERSDPESFGWLVVAPVMRPNPDLSGNQPIEGFVFSLFQLGPIIEDALGEFPPNGIDTYLFDRSESQGDRLLYVQTSPNRDHARARPSKADMRSWQKQAFDVAGQSLLLASAATDSYPARQSGWQPLLALLVGLSVTALAVRHLALAARRTDRVEEIVTRRTAELRKVEQLLRQLIDLQDRERKLIAYDIHDGLAQQLAGTLMRLQAFGSPRAAAPEKIESTCHELKQALAECLGEARRLISGLRPPILEEMGIVAAVDFLIDEQRQKGGPEIEFVTNARTDRFPPPLESTVFRIIQESLTNAVRYSQSDKVRVELSETDDQLHIEIQDWGIGFDPTATVGNRFGLQGIRERATLFDGTVEIDSTPGKGTRITVDLPRLKQTPLE